MKKTLAMSATTLALLALPAHAGPALDAFMAVFPEGTEVTFDREAVNGDAEVYAGVTITKDEDAVRIDRIALRDREDRILLSAAGVTFVEKNDLSSTAVRIDMAIPKGVSTLTMDMIAIDGDGMVVINTDGCAAFTSPFELRAEGLSFDAGGDVGSLTFRAQTDSQADDCMMNFEQEARGISVSTDMGVGITVESQRMRFNGSIAGRLPSNPAGETYESLLDISGIQIMMGGEPALRIGDISASGRIDGDSLVSLVEAGFNDHAETLNRALVEQKLPASQIPYADLWNGLRKVITDNRIAVTGVEVLGSGLDMISPVPGIFSEGSTFDAHIDVNKIAEIIDLNVLVDSSTLMRVSIKLAMKMEGMDALMNSMPPQMIALNTPLSMISGSLEVSDRGAFSLIENMTGVDPVAGLQGAISDTIGEEKSGMVGTWLENARDGGTARAVIAPENPLPVMAVGMATLGDWNTLGELLNFSQ